MSAQLHCFKWICVQVGCWCRLRLGEQDLRLIWGRRVVSVFLSVIGIWIWKFTSQQISAFLYVIWKVLFENLFSSVLFFCMEVESENRSLKKWLILPSLIQIEEKHNADHWVTWVSQFGSITCVVSLGNYWCSDWSGSYLHLFMRKDYFWQWHMHLLG